MKMKQKMKQALPLFILATLSACASDDSLTLEANFSSIQNDLFSKTCARVGCHTGTSPTAGLNLDAGQSYANLVDKLNAAGTKLLVNTGDSSKSYLIDKLEGASNISGERMPLNESAISQSNIDVIKAWIDNGAKNIGEE
ncbi:MAG TPA: hypothetical protein ENK06_11970 [Gammaproteobacteria bacterium]|nr:hypothetical protein [Gammaproteobacteria bacterium]